MSDAMEFPLFAAIGPAAGGMPPVAAASPSQARRVAARGRLPLRALSLAQKNSGQNVDKARQSRVRVLIGSQCVPGGLTRFRRWQ
jgi:hypothetical protein